MNQKVRFAITVVVIFCLGFSAGFIFTKLIHQETTLVETRDTGHFKFINPLLECDLADFQNDKNLDDLRNQLIAQIDQIKKNSTVNMVALYYRDLNNGPWIGINENELFSPASLVKVPLLITYYKLAETDHDLFQEKILNTTESGADPAQDIIPENVLELNKSYTIADLLKRMIIYSDNGAYNLLLNHIENRLLVKTYQDLGVDLTEAFKDPNGDILSVKTYASFYRILFNSSYLNKVDSEQVLSLLSQTTFNKGLTAKIPSNIVVSHKFGERQYQNINEKQIHDCGIVYTKNKPYLICIMTRGQDFTQLENTIQQLSATVFDATTNN